MFTWFATFEPYMVPLQLVFAMLGMGATLSIRDFVVIAKDPRGLLVGLALQLLWVPALTWLFIAGFRLSEGWAVGLVLVAVVPGGAFSNLLTFLGRGNVPLSISVTTASNLACIFSVPLLIQLLASASLPPDFAFPARRIVFEIFGYLLIPLALGMVVYRWNTAKAARFSKWCINTSIGFIALITLGSLGSGRIKIPEYGWLPPLRIVLFGLTLAVVTPHICRLVRRYDDDTTALTIEVCVRNVGVALLLYRNFFAGRPEQGHVLYTCLFYAGMSGLLTLPALLRHRFGRSPVLLRAPRRREPSDAGAAAE